MILFNINFNSTEEALLFYPSRMKKLRNLCAKFRTGKHVVFERKDTLHHHSALLLRYWQDGDKVVEIT